MLRIRLTRVGKKNNPFFRMVVTEKNAPVKGKFLELLGHYNPRSKAIELKKERILYWISQGAQPSLTAHNLLVKEEVIEGPKKIKKINLKKKEEAEEPKAEAPVKSETPETEEAKPEEEVKPEEEKAKEAPKKSTEEENKEDK